MGEGRVARGWAARVREGTGLGGLVREAAGAADAQGRGGTAHRADWTCTDMPCR